MIKAIIFDFGNVICFFDNNIFLENISRFTNKSVPELKELIYSSELQNRYETGLISSNEFFNKIVEKCNLSISKHEFIKVFTNIFTPIQTTLELIKKLKPKYKIALLSNTNELDFEHTIKPIEIFNLFNAVTLSFKVKAMKPDAKIYLDCLKKLNLKPEECVHIDDREDYVEAANKIGIKGIHYTGYDELVNSLKELGVLV